MLDSGTGGTVFALILYQKTYEGKLRVCFCIGDQMIRLLKMYFVTKWCSILFRYGVVTHYSGINVRYATLDNFDC